MLKQLKDLNKFNVIKFHENDHRYFINDRVSNGSITAVISSFKKPFETNKWSLHKAKQRNISQQEILTEWSANTRFSTTLGTLLHNYIENYWDNKIKKYDQQSIIESLGEQQHTDLRKQLSVFIKSFHGFYNLNKHILPVKSELVIGDIDNSRVCGMVDLLAYNSDTEQFEIYDYKSNKKFTTQNNFGEKYLHESISHLDVCDLNTYSLQQSLYKYIIEKYTSIKISKCYLVWFDRENGSCEKIPCKDLTSVCELLLKSYNPSK